MTQEEKAAILVTAYKALIDGGPWTDEQKILMGQGLEAMFAPVEYPVPAIPETERYRPPMSRVEGEGSTIVWTDLHAVLNAMLQFTIHPGGTIVVLLRTARRRLTLDAETGRDFLRAFLRDVDPHLGEYPEFTGLVDPHPLPGRLVGGEDPQEFKPRAFLGGDLTT